MVVSTSPPAGSWSGDDVGDGVSRCVRGEAMSTGLTAVPLDHQAGPAPERSVTILGATGSIGASTIDLIKRERSRYRVEALSGNTNASALAALARGLNARFAALAGPSAYDQL